MSRAIFTAPNYRLSKLLKKPGGKSIAAAIEAAAENVSTLKVPCLEHVDEALVEIDAHLRAFIEMEDKSAPAKALYDCVNAMIGLAGAVGLREVDRASFSLCDLLDRMMRTQRWEIEPIAVHVQSLHLLRQPAIIESAASVRAVMSGLQKVHDKVLSGRDEAL